MNDMKMDAFMLATALVNNGVCQTKQARELIEKCSPYVRVEFTRTEVYDFLSKHSDILESSEDDNYNHVIRLIDTFGIDHAVLRRIEYLMHCEATQEVVDIIHAYLVENGLKLSEWTEETVERLRGQFVCENPENGIYWPSNIVYFVCKHVDGFGLASMADGWFLRILDKKGFASYANEHKLVQMPRLWINKFIESKEIK